MPDSTTAPRPRPPLELVWVRPVYPGEPFVMVPRTMIRRADLTINARFVYMLLLDYRTQTGKSPSHTWLADNMGVSGRTVERAIQELTETGIISRRRGGRNHGNTYIINIDCRSDNPPPVSDQADNPPPLADYVEDNPPPVSEQDTDNPPKTTRFAATPYIKNNDDKNTTTPLRPPTGGSRAKPKTAMPAGFALTDERALVATKRGYSLPEAEHIFAKFTAHAEGSGRRLVNWDRGWLQWILTELERTAPGHVLKTNGAAPPRREHAADRAMRMAAELMEAERR